MAELECLIIFWMVKTFLVNTEKLQKNLYKSSTLYKKEDCTPDVMVHICSPS